ncbi:hypothetical protein FOQG_10928 [Fusarium oxysporum f. sp. raphani 54005]|uniref:Uncharacterized protein n=2 Tax=Fusarium oxysporum TaxID=5507 RepID=X0BSV0_FUSOX|nr:hypothetical protein FOVG_03883 [Fusarium oxysporum f. sp. pisi HDV247]EXK84966.1 hypothetical protein FOQG_10928 [Fusarium oxysporum f. sp. raphani 54005]
MASMGIPQNGKHHHLDGPIGGGVTLQQGPKRPGGATFKRGNCSVIG